MAKKKRLSALIKFLHKVPRPVLLALFIISIFVSLLALRHNNVQMIHLRDQVYVADKNNGNVNQALNNLRSYVYGHMNTDLSSGGNAIKPPIQLKYTYQRLEEAAQGPIRAANTQLYTDAENYCQATVPNGYYGAYRIPCVQDYLSNHGLKTAPQPVPEALYKFDFVSPAWSPDFAGWSLIVSAFLLLLYLINLVTHHLFGNEQKSKS